MKRFLAMTVAMLVVVCAARAQTPTQIKQLLPNTPSVVFNWTYNTPDEAFIDSFVKQRTAFTALATITSPYDFETVISQKTARTITFALPAQTTAGMKCFYRMIARKQGLADSVPSNIVQIEIVPTPPAVQNLNIARFTEVEFTRKSLDGVKLWFITKVL